LRDHTSPAGHRHHVFPAAVEAWAEFGGLTIHPTAPGRQIAPATLHLDPLHGLHLPRTLGDLGRPLDTRLSPLGAATDTQRPPCRAPPLPRPPPRATRRLAPRPGHRPRPPRPPHRHPAHPPHPGLPPTPPRPPHGRRLRRRNHRRHPETARIPRDRLEHPV